MQTLFEHTVLSAVQAVKPVSHWDASMVYIGMPGKATAAFHIPDEMIGPFGKPWECLKDPRGWETAYRVYLYDRIATDADFALAVRDLHGKTLLCWCASKPSATACHGQTLARAAEWLFHGIEDVVIPAPPKRKRAPRKAK